MPSKKRDSKPSMGDQLDEWFVPHPEVKIELESICRLHSISPEELFYKWESYSMKMGQERTRLDVTTVREFKKDLQESVEREAKSKSHMRSVDKRGAYATPRNAAKSGNVFGMLDSVTPVQHTPSAVNKRKSTFETPSIPKSSKVHATSSPSDARLLPSRADQDGNQSIAFAERQNSGQIIETINGHLDVHEAPIAPHPEPRVKLTANTDLKKFRYRPMAMHLSEASEVLDDRIDEFQSLIQAHHDLDDSAFGNAAAQGTNEIVAVGRIASDTPEGRLNAASMVLETSRRTGAGLRVPLKVEPVSYQFFPGQIVAVRGINASGDYLSVSEILDVPLLAPAASQPSTLETFNERLGVTEDEDSSVPSKALNLIVASGPYTADDNLAFEPLHAICRTAEETCADMLILIGPLFDTEHPLLASGDFNLPDDPSIEPDRATLADAFRILIAKPLQALAQAVPSITIVCIPSTRDLLNKHVSWPQDNLPGKKLGLPKQAKMVSNPVTVSINEIVVAISAQDILYELRREEIVVGKPKESNLLARLPRHLIQQRHFFPLYPPVDRTLLPKTGTQEGIATGTPIDVSYLKLGEWLEARPDMLIQPSALPQFAKVVENVLVVNPGPLSKRKGAGTYARLTVYPRRLTSEERDKGALVGHRLFERARVDVVRI
ncbi:MAG: hypothetical protein LQ338_004107 [Usnochroma carphineum]|nr:MAG: hypothetical protein LQ338_004107 [Usnochroma carphineum]